MAYDVPFHFDRGMIRHVRSCVGDEKGCNQCNYSKRDCAVEDHFERISVGVFECGQRSNLNCRGDPRNIGKRVRGANTSLNYGRNEGSEVGDVVAVCYCSFGYSWCKLSIQYSAEYRAKNSVAHTAT